MKILILALYIVASLQLDNGLGLTPQMGWNSWNHFGCKIDETLIKKTTDLLISTRLAAKGYKYVNLDDCWQIARNSTTKEIIQDKTHFPSGMKALSDYVHAKGLKFGLYSDAGEKTCQGRPGSAMRKLMPKLMLNGIDYLKYDNCYNTSVSGKTRYFAMMKALNQSGRHIFYSMCNWGTEKPWEWAPPMANSWRTTGDISDNWKSFVSILDQQVGLQKYASKGAWNDPDMLEVGNGGMTHDEYYAHFSLWCVLKAPLLIGCSLETMSQQTKTILGNEQLIAINQDSLGKQGWRIKRETRGTNIDEVWGGDLSNNRFAVVFFNRGDAQTNISVSIKNDLKKTVTQYTVRDAINHKDLGKMTSDTITVSVKKHAVVVYVLKFGAQDTNNLLAQQ